MTRMQKKRVNLRKTKPKKVQESRELSLIAVLKSSTKFVLLYKRTFLLWCLGNFAFLYLFSFIPNGWTNSLSILWLVAYYVFWCIFIRCIQQHIPYFSLVRTFNGLIPVSKIMFINISIYLLIIIIPFVPMFMGFHDKYVEFFEGYMGLISSHNSMTGTTLFYIFMLLISPYTLLRPYLAWIASLIGKSRSIVDAYKRTHHNYWKFVGYGAMMSSLFVLSYYIDNIYKVNTIIYLGTFLPVYFNIVFINIYKVFYKRKAKIKTTSY